MWISIVTCRWTGSWNARAPFSALWRLVISQDGHLVLYDITSSYFEGAYTQSDIVTFGYNRDGKRGVTNDGDRFYFAARGLSGRSRSFCR